MKPNQLMLFNANVIFANLDPNDEQAQKYGTSISILTGECGEEFPELHEALDKYYDEHKIGKEGDEHIGSPLYKDTEDGTEEYITFKITNRTRYVGLGKEALDEGSNVDLVLNCYHYDNEFGKGNSISVAMVNVNSAGRRAVLEDALLKQKKQYEKRQRALGREAEAGATGATEAKPDTTPPLEGGGARATSEQAGPAKAQGVSEPTISTDDINLSDIPF